MEREFLGFTSKNSPWITIKEDASNKPKEPVRSSAMQWSFSNNASNLPQFLSFKNTHEDRSRNIVMDPIGSSGYMTTQENVTIGNKHGVYPMQCSEAQTICNQETRIFSVSNQSNNQMCSVLPPNLATTGINIVNSVTRSQSFGSKSSATPLSVLPSIGSIVGSTDLRNRNCSKSNGTIPAQLTIFYGGSVCVYDDISPEKAKAIMLLAGNGTKKQPEISIPSKKDGFIISQSYASPLPSPLPMTSHANSQQRGGSSSNNDITILRSLRPSSVPNNHLESSIVATSIGSAPKEMIQSVCLPQARKASLTRFLEKRKERAMSTSPYYMNKKSHESSTPGSDSASFSIDFSGSSSQATTNLRTSCMEV
ncbi:protein TIFY 6B-like [Vicia villosa]|uniref:protein TIFY 6B-like n=1 Tax=Vicia villosa TaxID=3911 RepID=UPI00273AC64E|nr:protein TIFY 6B-like [Vicia villosa]